MASLSPPFILCPLPDRQALLGIRGDRLQNKAIVTLGRNIAIRYHIPEQKQESSWTTSRYWFTSAVTYCHDVGKYGAVLNHNIVALWDEGDSNLSNITKLKLPDNVLDLHTSSTGRTVIVMKNGKVGYYSDIADNKNSVTKGSFLAPKETLVNFYVDEKKDHCYLITKKEAKPKNEVLSLIRTSITDINGDIIKPCRLPFGIGSHKVLGQCLLQSEIETFLVFFCSDGFIYKQTVNANKGDTEPVKLSSLVKYVNNSNEVVLSPLNDNTTVAIYACNPMEEGAVVVIYDVHYDVVVSKQPLKLYSIPPLMEGIGQSLVVPLGLHILVLNYHITKSLLSSVVGKHQAKLDEEVFEGRNPWVSDGWNIGFDKPDSATEGVKEKSDKEDLKKAYPLIWEIMQQAKILESEGQPESVICNHIIPLALEKNNNAALDWILNTFLDIPEVHMISMIAHCLQDAVSSTGVFNNSDRLNQLLIRQFDKKLVTLSLRHVEYDDAKKLLLYINYLIQNHWKLDTEEEENSMCMKSWLKWCSSIIDAHYTKFVLHDDTAIIEDLLQTISECTNVMKAIEEIEPYITLTYSKTSFEPCRDNASKWRTETVIFD